MAVVEHFGKNSRGGTQMRRRWEPDNAKAAVLIVHGIGEHSGRYIHVGDHLAAHGYDVLAYDKLGFGQSEGRRAHVDSFDDYLDDVQALIAERRSLGLPVVLFGHSLGGLVSTTYLVSERPHPDFAILSAPALEAEVERWKRIAAPLMGRVAPTLFIPNKIDGVLLSRDVAVQQAYVDDPLVVAGATAALGRAIFATMESTSARIDRISVPTYVFHGGDDELVRPAASAPLEAHPHVTYRLWDGLRHETMNEPEQVTVLAAITDWLDAQIT
jgi:alpha-beta hydrolase superfamily lysophospholipase